MPFLGEYLWVFVRVCLVIDFIVNISIVFLFSMFSRVVLEVFNRSRSLVSMGGLYVLDFDLPLWSNERGFLLILCCLCFSFDSFFC